MVIILIASLLAFVVFGVMVYMILSSRKKSKLIPDSKENEDENSEKVSAIDDKNSNTEIEKLKREICKLKKENDYLKSEMDYYKSEFTSRECDEDNDSDDEDDAELDDNDFDYEDDVELEDDGIVNELLDKYQFNETRKVYVSRDSGDYFCTSCLQDGIESRLQKSTTGWQCKLRECSKLYGDPSFKLSKRRKN